mgnify:CR=1 FL=1
MPGIEAAHANAGDHSRLLQLCDFSPAGACPGVGGTSHLPSHNHAQGKQPGDTGLLGGGATAVAYSLIVSASNGEATSRPGGVPALTLHYTGHVSRACLRRPHIWWTTSSAIYTGRRSHCICSGRRREYLHRTPATAVARYVAVRPECMRRDVSLNAFNEVSGGHAWNK